jgi:hypothetical protein
MPNPESDWDNTRNIRALDLMKKAGWIAKCDIDALSVGVQMTPHGQQQAETFFRIFRELECRSLEDLESVLGVISWYLNKDRTN